MLVGLLLQHQRTIDNEVLVLHVLCQANLVDRFAGDTVKLTVADGDIVDGIGQFGVVVAHNHHAIFRLLTGDVLHGHVAYRGVEATTAHLLGLVVGIDFQHGLFALANGDVAHIDVLNDATTTRVGLDAQHTIQIR